MAGPVTAVVSGQTKAPSPARPGTPGDPGDVGRANVQVCTLSISSEPGPLNGSQDGVLEAGRGTCPTEADLAIRNLKSFQKHGLFFQKSASISPAVPNWHVPSRTHLRGVQAKPHRSLPLWLPTPHSRPYSGSWTLLTLSLPCSPGFLRPQRCQAGGLW